jgi:hypothetical protein
MTEREPAWFWKGHFLLVPLLAVLAFYARNAHNYGPAGLIFPVGCLLAGAAGVFLLVFSVRRSSGQAALLTTFAMFLFHLYGPLTDSFPVSWMDDPHHAQRIHMAALVTGTVAWGLAWLILARSGWNPIRLHRPLTTVFGLLCLVQVFTAWQADPVPAQKHRPAPVPPASSTVEAPHGKPNIYIIVLDAYTSGEVLRKSFDYDNTWFLDRLRQLGFTVHAQARSNYFLSMQSIASALNLQPVPGLVEGTDPDRANPEVYHRLINGNILRQTLRQRGYRFVATPIGFDPLEPNGADVYVTPPYELPPLARAFFETTPLRWLLHNDDAYRDLVLHNLGVLPSLRQYGPALIYSHLTVPHPPFVFDRKGRPAGRLQRVTFNDGADYLRSEGSREAYLSGYRDQVHFVSERILDVLASILREDTSDPIIVLTGDHGVRLDHDPQNPTPEGLRSACAILNAVRLPGNKPTGLADDPTLLEVMRRVAEELSIDPGEADARRIYLSHPNRPYRFTEVTDQVHPADR